MVRAVEGRVITTEAWVIHRGPRGAKAAAELRLETVRFAEPKDGEVLVESLYGSWEANMDHAIRRDPVDVCRLRREDPVILGNSGVVRVLKDTSGDSSLIEGQICLFCPGDDLDELGFPRTISGYDTRGSMGLLAKLMKAPRFNFFPLPVTAASKLLKWSAFPVRFLSAWSNWRAALACWRSQQPPDRKPTVWAWGGGVGVAEAWLARLEGCQATVISSTADRLELIRSLRLNAVDRRPFASLSFSPDRYREDQAYRLQYLQHEKAFQAAVLEITGPRGVDIFIDNIGTPVSRATAKVLAREGVIATTGWKHGRSDHIDRVVDCTSRRIRVHTHGCGLHEIKDAVDAALKYDWLPPVAEPFPWSSIPTLASRYATASQTDLFPIYKVSSYDI